MIKCPSCLRVNQGGTPNCIHCGAIIGSQIWWGRLLSGIKSFFTRFVPKKRR